MRRFGPSGERACPGRPDEPDELAPGGDRHLVDGLLEPALSAYDSKSAEASPKSTASFVRTSSASVRSWRRRNFSNSTSAGWRDALREAVFSASSAPTLRPRRHSVTCDEYRPLRRRIEAFSFFGGGVVLGEHRQLVIGAAHAGGAGRRSHHHPRHNHGRGRSGLQSASTSNKAFVLALRGKVRTSGVNQDILTGRGVLSNCMCLPVCVGPALQMFLHSFA